MQDSQNFELTPLNQPAAIIVKKEQLLFETPSPAIKKQKFNLSELDSRQSAIIPIPVNLSPEVKIFAEKRARKAEKKSRKKLKFDQMLAGFQPKVDAPMPFEVQAGLDSSTRFLE